MLDAERSRALEEPVHRVAVERPGRTPEAVRLGEPREQLEVHFLREPPERAVADLVAHLEPHARLQMLCDDAEDLLPHVVPLDRSHVQPVEEARRRRHPLLLVIDRADATVEKGRRGGFAEVVAHGAQHHHEPLGPGQVVHSRARLVDHLQRVNPDIALGMPLRLLRAADERVQFGKQPFDDAQVERQREPD